MKTTKIPSENDKTAIIYNDLGVSKNLLNDCEKLCKNWGYTPQFTDAVSIANDILIKSKATLFIIPGGADVPYTQKLNGQPNQNIRNWVENGGIYLGICAGGYYGCSALNWHNGDEIITGNRELSFYTGTCHGPLFPYDVHVDTSVSCPIQMSNGTIYHAHYNGGGVYYNHTDTNTHIWATYHHQNADGKPFTYNIPTTIPWHQNNQHPAIVATPIEQGLAILSAIHFETQSTNKDHHNHHLSIQDYLKKQITQIIPTF